MPQSLTTAEASAEYGLHVRKLQRLCVSGQLKAKSVGGSFVITRASLDKYVAAKADRLSRRGRKPGRKAR